MSRPRLDALESANSNDLIIFHLLVTYTGSTCLDITFWD